MKQLSAFLAFLMPTVLCAGMDWYTNYTFNDTSLVAHYDFNGGGLQDGVSRKSVAPQGAAFVEGWVPQDGYALDGKGRLSVADVPGCERRGDYTVGVYARVVGGGGYLILKKGAFGISFNDGQARVYVRTAKRDFTIPAGGCDSGWHFWAWTVAGSQVSIYRDGVKVGGRALPEASASGGEPLLVGHSGGWSKLSIEGEVKSLFVYSRALSPKELAELGAAFAARRRPGPLSGLELSLPIGAGNKFYADNVGYEKKEQALHFNGTDACAVLPDYPQLRAPKGLTVGCWIKPEKTMPRKLEEQGYIVSHNSGAHAGWCLGTYYNNGLHAMVVTDQGKFSAEAAQVLKPNVWQHVAFGWDGARLQLFVNGRAVGAAVATKGALKPLGGRAVVGRAADRNGLYFQGAVDELRIYAAGLLPEADPEAGREVVTAASNTDPSPDPRHLPPFQETAGRAPQHRPLFDFEDLGGWTVHAYKNITSAEFVRSQDDRLWGDYTGKLTVSLGSIYDPSRRSVALRPPKPIAITEPFDYVELWISAQNWAQGVNRPKAKAVFRGADGERLEVPMVSAEHPFIYWSGWSLAMKKLPRAVKLPARFEELVFYDFSGSKPNVLYLDNLAVFQMPKTLPPGVEIPTWEQVGIQGAATGIARPAASTAEPAMALRREGRAYLFQAEKPAVAWRYLPGSGTLGDLTVAFQGGKAIRPMRGGGFRFATPEGADIQPDDPRLSARLLSCEASAGGVTSRWQWSYGGVALERTAITLKGQGHTLTVALSSEGGAVREVVFGEVEGCAAPVVSTVPYWVTRGRDHTDPAILYSEGMVLSEFVDIYASRGSKLVGGSRLRNGVAMLNGGVEYGRKTDGRRNPVSELFHVTASDEVAKALPHIPNPPNPTNAITRDAIWMSNAWYGRMPMPDYFDRCFARQKLLYDYGLRNLFVRDHQSIARQYSPKRRGGYCSMMTRVCPDLGGDAAAEVYLRRCITELGYRMGFYSNYTLLDVCNPDEAGDSKLALDSNGDPRYGSNEARMFKYAYILGCQRRLNAILRKKFSANLAYPDQFTCRAPWEYTDFDARVPEAGSFNPVLRVFAESMLQEKRDFQVTLSEGIMQWPLAGFVDSYAQPGSVDDPLFPEFQLREIHPLGNDCGAHLSLVNDRRPGAVDRLLTMTLGNGNIAHIYCMVVGDGAPLRTLTYAHLKSYYAMVQAQKHYADTRVAEIRYHLGGRMLTATEVLKADAVKHGQVYTRYANGFEIWANANPTETWEITAAGRKHLLPPYGYYVYGSGMAEGGSELVDGRRVDSLQGDQWLFASGGGKPHDFGFMRCRGAYAVRWEKGVVEVIGLPEALDEEIEVDLSALPVAPGKTAVYLDHQGRAVRTAPVELRGGRLRLKMGADAFKARVQAAE